MGCQGIGLNLGMNIVKVRVRWNSTRWHRWISKQSSIGNGDKWEKNLLQFAHAECMIVSLLQQLLGTCSITSTKVHFIVLTFRVPNLVNFHATSSVCAYVWFSAALTRHVYMMMATRVTDLQMWPREWCFDVSSNKNHNHVTPVQIWWATQNTQWPTNPWCKPKRIYHKPLRYIMTKLNLFPIHFNRDSEQVALLMLGFVALRQWCDLEEKTDSWTLKWWLILVAWMSGMSTYPAICRKEEVGGAETVTISCQVLVSRFPLFKWKIGLNVILHLILYIVLETLKYNNSNPPIPYFLTPQPSNTWPELAPWLAGSC